MLFQVTKSNKIVVIGGGPVGVELVGELATDFPDKKVTLMHNREQILDDRLSRKFVKRIQDGMKALKVETVLGERVDMDDLNVSRITKILFGSFRFETFQRKRNLLVSSTHIPTTSDPFFLFLRIHFCYPLLKAWIKMIFVYSLIRTNHGSQGQ